MKLISLDDFIDVYVKLRQRGGTFIFSKLNYSGLSRTKSAFSDSSLRSANWWQIPEVQKRWNTLITGDANTDHVQYLMDQFFSDKRDLKLISLGSGYSHNELAMAEYSQFKEIICIDMAQNRLLAAEQNAQKRNLNNIKFVCSPINEYDLPENYFDVVYFNSSLHHFKNVENLLKSKIKNCLTCAGKLIINEYVGPNRLQFPPHQIKEINKALDLIPAQYKKRLKTNMTKTKFYGPGWIRMIIADPSECIDSSSIKPAIHTHFHTIVEKPYGGNILMSALRDISHHFIELDAQKEEILNKLFILEDNYLKYNPSDFIFGIYEKPPSGVKSTRTGFK